MIKIVTDSTANLPPDIVAKYSIHVIPLRVIFGSDTRLDGVDINTEDFYRLLEASDELPRTSQPPSAEFFELYSGLLQEDTEIVSIHISSALSGTVNSAQAAREMLPNPGQVRVVDTRFTAMATGMMTIAAAEAALTGRTSQEILAMLDRMIQGTTLYLVVDTLKYLAKGGRIGGAAAFLGSALSIKPLLSIQDGRVEPIEKIRTKSKATSHMIDLLEQKLGHETPIWTAAIHTNALPDAEMLLDRVRSRFNCTRTYVADAGPTLGTHVGPGCLALAMVADPATF